MALASTLSRRTPRPRRRLSLSAWRRGARAARLSWLLLITLLLQQVAIVAYACERTDTGPVATSMAMAGMPDCEGMKVPPVPAACEKHCHPDPQTPGDARVPPVPPSAVPVAHVDLVHVLLPVHARQPWMRVPVHATDPPPRRRFGVLLI